MPRDTFCTRALGPELAHRVQTSKILMVGAGGIGCELLKNLVMMGFGDIVIVDLDTIDLSNLNRQFLFGLEHVKKSKALVAKESASKFNPGVNITAHHANIKDSQFDVSWFGQFDLVLNALDNLDARRHVNRYCLAAQVPLIESGTAGFNGQVQVIVGGQTECYDCNPKPVTKTFPVCTIRSTPSQPVHCIVWAKSYLFQQLFGGDDVVDEAEISDNKDDDDTVQEKQQLVKEANELKALRNQLLNPDFFVKMIDNVFRVEIARLASMDTMWVTRRKPEPLVYEGALQEKVEAMDAQEVVSKDQKIWSLEENLAVLRQSVERLAKRLRSENPSGIEFDKDDKDTLDFVAAAANIRSYLFHIELKSEFDIKQIAGSIIPAIATSNAIVASLSVLQGLKVLAGKLDEARMVFLSRQPDRVFSTERLQGPNPYCVVSGVSRATIRADVSILTIGDLVEAARQKLGLSDDISIMSSTLVYDVDFDDNVNKTLAELSIEPGSFITIVDEEEDDQGRLRANVELYVEAGQGLGHDIEFLRLPEVKFKPQKADDEMDADTERDLVEAVSGVKRKADDEDGHADKRAKIEQEVIVLDEDDVIEID